eukprot:gene1164-1735_t
MTTIRRFTCDDLFTFNNVNLDVLTETVAPEFRRQQLAAKLMDGLEEITDQKHKGYFVDLFVRISNSVAIGMYKKVSGRPMHELVENIHNIVHAGATENKVENLIDLDTMKAWTRQMQTDSNGQTRGQAWAATLYGEEFTMEHAGGALFGTTSAGAKTTDVYSEFAQFHVEFDARPIYKTAIATLKPRTVPDVHLTEDGLLYIASTGKSLGMCNLPNLLKKRKTVPLALLRFEEAADVASAQGRRGPGRG